MTTQRLGHLSVFFPAYNEQDNITPLLNEALEVLPRFAERLDIIVIDDGSRDQTANIVNRFAARHPEIRLVSHKHNLGYGEAIRSGLVAARGDAVFFTDADRQFRLTDLDRLLDEFAAHSLAIGFRIKRHDPWHRLVVAWIYHRVLRWTFGLRVADVDCAFKLIGREALDDVLDKLESASAFISPELLIRAWKAGIPIVEVGVPHYPRAFGRAKGASVKVILRTIREIVTMRRKLGSLARREAGLAIHHR